MISTPDSSPNRPEITAITIIAITISSTTPATSPTTTTTTATGAATTTSAASAAAMDHRRHHDVAGVDDVDNLHDLDSEGLEDSVGNRVSTAALTLNTANGDGFSRLERFPKSGLPGRPGARLPTMLHRPATDCVAIRLDGTISSETYAFDLVGRKTARSRA
jgi:hypothetical protein